jgi:hypothetical protein
VGVYELLSVTRSMRELLAERAPESAIRAAALAEGMRTLRQDALAKARAGQTTLEEVLRITPADRSRRAPATAAAPAPQPAARRPAADGTAAHHKASTDRAARAWPGAPAAGAPAQPGMR